MTYLIKHSKKSNKYLENFFIKKFKVLVELSKKKPLVNDLIAENHLCELDDLYNLYQYVLLNRTTVLDLDLVGQH